MTDTDPARIDFDEQTRAFLKALASETRQLAVLRAGRLLIARRDGKLVRYRGDGEGVAAQLVALQDYLRRCCPPGS